MSSANVTVFVDARKATKQLTNLVEYMQGFVEQAKREESTVTKAVAAMSVEGFYDYMDSLARVHPDMLHHVYEWGQVGNPNARLFELKTALAGDKAVITAELLESRTIQPGSNEPFREKAEIMEEGIPVTINEVNAEALFFQIDGEEYFRLGPITIENPGGEATRGSFVHAFETFYNSYFQDVYLNSIKFYRNFSDASIVAKNAPNAIRSGNPRGLGRNVAKSWVLEGLNVS